MESNVTIIRYFSGLESKSVPELALRHGWARFQIGAEESETPDFS